MVQHLRALTALVEDPGLIPSTHMAAYNHLIDITPSSQESNSLFWPVDTRHSHGTQTCRQKLELYISTEKKVILFFTDYMNNTPLPHILK